MKHLICGMSQWRKLQHFPSLVLLRIAIRGLEAALAACSEVVLRVHQVQSANYGVSWLLKNVQHLGHRGRPRKMFEGGHRRRRENQEGLEPEPSLMSQRG